MKFRPVGAELFHADGLTDVMKIIAGLRNFADSPKACVINESIVSTCSSPLKQFPLQFTFPSIRAFRT